MSKQFRQSIVVRAGDSLEGDVYCVVVRANSFHVHLVKT